MLFSDIRAYNKLDSFFIGFDKFFNELEALDFQKRDAFPPYNVYQVGKNKIELELAVSGFKRENLQVTLDKKTELLTVSGSSQPAPTLTNASTDVNRKSFEVEVPDENVAETLSKVKTDMALAPADSSRVALYRGIAGRKFIRTFKVSNEYEVVSATCNDGLLLITLERAPPETAKPTVINIT